MKYFAALALTFLCLSCSKASTVDPQKVYQKLPPERLALANELEDQKGDHIHMPPIPTDFPAERYINILTSELREQLKGKVVLIDIWDYTCVNCIRTLPYITAWNEKYKDKGLVILGVHAPEFEFEKAPENLDSAVKKFNLTYPIIADNDYKIWQSLANNYWPAKYIFDKDGILRASHFGEGEYEVFEAFIQKLLVERDSSISLPDLTKPVRETDKPGAVCYRATPETYIGFARSHYGNDGEPEPNKPTQFTLPKELKQDELYLGGTWVVKREYAYPAGGSSSSSLNMNYQAKEVNLVIHPLATGPFHVEIQQNGKPLAKEDRGTDIIEENGKTYIKIDGPRMYNLINNSKFGRATFSLVSDSPNFGAYAFTFTSSCQTE